MAIMPGDPRLFSIAFANVDAQRLLIVLVYHIGCMRSDVEHEFDSSMPLLRMPVVSLQFAANYGTRGTLRTTCIGLLAIRLLVNALWTGRVGTKRKPRVVADKLKSFFPLYVPSSRYISKSLCFLA